MVHEQPVQGGRPGSGSIYARNAAWIVAGEAAARIAAIVLFVVVARLLSPTEFSYFYFALVFVPLLLVPSSVGLNTVIVREVARRPNEAASMFISAFTSRFALGVVALVAAVALAPFLTDSGDALAVVVLVGAGLLLDELVALTRALFIAFDRAQLGALVTVANRVVTTVLIVASAVVGGRVIAISIAYLAGSALAATLSLALLRRHFFRLQLSAWSRAVATSLLVAGVPIGIANFLNTALLRADAVILQAIRGPAEVATYGIAYRFFESFLFVSWGVAAATLPRLSRASSVQESMDALQQAFATLFLVYLPFAVTTPFAADWIVTTVFSAKYEAAAGVAGVLAIAAVFYAAAHVARIAVIAVGRTKLVAWVAAVALVVNLGANLLLIPSYGFTAAAWITLASAFLEAVLLLAIVSALHKAVPRLGRIGVVPLAASGVLLILLVLTGTRGSTAVLLAALVYPLLVVVAARALNVKQLMMWRRSVS